MRFNCGFSIFREILTLNSHVIKTSQYWPTPAVEHYRGRGCGDKTSCAQYPKNEI